MKFRILWALDALFAGVPVYFFLVGLQDGSVSSFNILLWLVLLLVLAGVLGGSVLLRSHGHRVAAWLVLAVLAVPGLLGVFFFILVLLLKPRWN